MSRYHTLRQRPFVAPSPPDLLVLHAVRLLTVWFQLHEDLLATLGVQRGAGPA
jgi:hypothetical protein